MKRAFFACIVACAALATPTTARSIVVDANQNPDQVEQLGFPTAYHVEGTTPDYPYNVSWLIRQTDAETAQPAVANPYRYAMYNFSYPGTFELSAIITYGSVSRPGSQAPAPQTAIKTVTIQPPMLKAITNSIPGAPYASKPGQYAPQTSPNQLGESPGQWVYLSSNPTAKPSVRNIV